MKKYLERLPKEIRELVYFTKDLAAYRGMPAYLVGGFVRDLILGVRNFDLDIVVVGDGIKFAEYFSRALKAKLIRHKRFGTATVVLKPGLKIDIATARSEFYPHPAHLPVVKPGSLKDDLFRRDFTINAMAISLVEKDFGRLIDCYGGKNDLKARSIRVLHALSFIDDPTRIIRAIRFEQRFDFKIDPDTLKLLKEA
ncbi:MAG: tRNA nucleotidyltransferase, partial [Candidatus Omnitrophica bacterium]|nr:tRNA nucleotidyltransferase [Candidatus Omnitrophota bacterium]